MTTAASRNGSHTRKNYDTMTGAQKPAFAKV
jgi:hypothetical protein